MTENCRSSNCFVPAELLIVNWWSNWRGQRQRQINWLLEFISNTTSVVEGASTYWSFNVSISPLACHSLRCVCYGLFKQSFFDWSFYPISQILCLRMIVRMWVFIKNYNIILIDIFFLNFMLKKEWNTAWRDSSFE